MSLEAEVIRRMSDQPEVMIYDRRRYENNGHQVTKIVLVRHQAGNVKQLQELLDRLAAEQDKVRRKADFVCTQETVVIGHLILQHGSEMVAIWLYPTKKMAWEGPIAVSTRSWRKHLRQARVRC